MMKKLIDISEHNGAVDLSKAKPYIDGVIARCSWGWDNADQIDKQWDNNAQQANAIGLPLFAYHFCYARNAEEAKREAALVLKACNGYQVNVIYYDIEYSDYQGNLTPAEYYQIAKAFCDSIEENGYAVGIYANEHYFKTKLTNDGFSKWTLWLANYGKNDGTDNWYGKLRYNPFGNVLLHQCTSNAKKGIFQDIQGISSSFLDGNIDHGVLRVFGGMSENDDIIELTLNDKVKVKKGSTWYDGEQIASFVFDKVYSVIEIRGDRIVIGINGKVTGAIKRENLMAVK